MEDHLYMPSITGRCHRSGCGKTRDEHLSIEAIAQVYQAPSEPDPAEPFKCSANHSSVAISHNGERWTACPICGDMLEPKLATGKFESRWHGPGRGELTWRQAKVVMARVGWRAWLAANGGGEVE